MVEYTIEPDILAYRKYFPGFYADNHLCKKCKGTTILLERLSGGFINRRCVFCGTEDTVSFPPKLSDLRIILRCPNCESFNFKEIQEERYSNYGYVCQICKTFIRTGYLLQPCENFSFRA